MHLNLDIHQAIKFISCGSWAPGTEIFLYDNRLNNDNAEYYARVLGSAIEHSNCRNDLDLIFICTPLGGDKVASIFGHVISSGNCPIGLGLRFGGYPNQIGTQGALDLAAAIQSDKSPVGLRLELYGHNIGIKGIEALALAIKSGKCSELGLIGYRMGDEGAKIFACSLHLIKMPISLKLDLTNNGIGDAGAIAFADNIKSAKYPITLNLSYNDIGFEGMTALAETLLTNFNLVIESTKNRLVETLSTRNKLLQKFPEYKDVILPCFIPIYRKLARPTDHPFVPKLRFFAQRATAKLVSQPPNNMLEVSDDLKNQLENLGKILELEHNEPIIKDMAELLQQSALPRDLLQELLFLMNTCGELAVSLDGLFRRPIH